MQNLFRDVVFGAVAIGLVCALVYQVYHGVFLMPIIEIAEQFEALSESEKQGSEKQGSEKQGSEKQGSEEQGAEQGSHDHHVHDHSPDLRTMLTFTANVLISTGFALVMLCAAVAHNLYSAKPATSAARGVLWGIAVFFAVFLSPLLVGLGPELPGSGRGDLANRQALWVGSVALGALTIGCLYYGSRVMKRLGFGLSLIVWVVVTIIDGSQNASSTITEGESGPSSTVSALQDEFLMVVGFGMLLLFTVMGALVGWRARIIHSR